MPLPVLDLGSEPSLPAASPRDQAAHASQDDASAQRRKPAAFRWRYRHLWQLFVAALALVTLRTFVGEASVVPTGSMEGTILVGDHLLLNKLLYGPDIPLLGIHLPRWKTIRRGDIVVFRYPRNPGETFLKRVIALGGDRVEIRKGKLYLNSIPVEEPYVVHCHPGWSSHEDEAAVVVPADSLFVMGDNRDNSSDSRDWGFVPEQNVIGEPLLVYWSYDAPSSLWLDPDLHHQMSFDVSIVANFFSRTRWVRVGMLL